MHLLYIRKPFQQEHYEPCLFSAICVGGCLGNSYCAKPGVCKCRPGFKGESELSGGKCVRREAERCAGGCMNGGKCWRGRCKCSDRYIGKRCQYKKTSKYNFAPILTISIPQRYSLGNMHDFGFSFVKKLTSLNIHGIKIEENLSPIGHSRPQKLSKMI